jgi:hypothetical protein
MPTHSEHHVLDTKVSHLPSSIGPQGLKDEEEKKGFAHPRQVSDTKELHENPQDLPSPFRTERPKAKALTPPTFRMNLRSAKVLKSKFPISFSHWPLASLII